MARKSIDHSTSGKGNVIDMKTQQLINVPKLPVICDRIRHYRIQKGIEQKAMGLLLGISGNTICNWENGRARPDINLLPSICQILDISLYQLLGETDPNIKLSPHETNLVAQYRDLTQGHKRAVDTLINSLQFAQTSENCRKIKKLITPDKSLAAGIGDPTEPDITGTETYLYASPLVDRADFIFGVNGDSMEPTYHSGDKVLVQRIYDVSSLPIGDIGAFSVGNEMYIKKRGENSLLSLNPDYPPMVFSEEESVYLIGKVIGICEASDFASEEDIDMYLRLNPEKK